MFCSNVMVIQATSFIQGEFDHFFSARGEANFTKNNVISMTDYGLNGYADLIQLNAEVAQYFGRDPFSFTHKAEQEVFSANVVMLKALGFFLSEAQDLPGPLGELIIAIPIH